jgi:molecular chaperone GrpE
MRKRHHAGHAPAEPAAPGHGGLGEGPEPAPDGRSQDDAQGAGAGASSGTAAADGGADAAAIQAGAPGPAAAVPVEPPGSAVPGLEREVADQRDRLLRMAADFDNFRKRAAREKAETWGRAQGDLIQKVLEVIDDLGRVAHLDPAQTGAEALHEGMGLVERKFLKVLETVGLERVDPSGQTFDPNAHEAVMTTPTPSPELDGGVAMVFQAGYRLNGMLLRPARVSVYAYAEPAPGDVVH